ncbi:hypothetical protein A2U01_0083110 [Trifolium medium]|uniref:Uncharacterized protein n=1 Tax=Trifolium medium TaxID=97028 RepID=A0A392TL32_9FABA|nr:hypothetical protein [Trifolium medium]
MARCAGHGVRTGKSSGSCASCSLVWRVAQLNQAVEVKFLVVARRA